jgi:hypothetical protein
MTDMQPETPQPQPGQFGPEVTPVIPSQNTERIPVLPTPEAGVDIHLERTEQAAEAGAAAADAAAPVMPVVTPTTQLTDDDVSTTVGPPVANDDDVIETEWVKNAKEIVASTKDDPHARSAKVSELQKDYLKKRYGKEIGAAA